MVTERAGKRLGVVVDSKFAETIQSTILAWPRLETGSRGGVGGPFGRTLRSLLEWSCDEDRH
jgi:hypothetical protein